MSNATNILPGFDLDKLRLTQDFGGAVDVQKEINTVPIRKPPKSTFFRVKPGDDWRASLMTIEQEGEYYLLAPEVWHLLPDLERPTMLHLAVDRQGNPFLIPITLAGPDGKQNQWHQSLAGAARIAEEKWIRCSANRMAGSYDVLVARAEFNEPDWPDKSLEALVEIAFRQHVIASPDHPLIQQLLGLS